MTRIDPDQPVKWETDTIIAGRRIVIELHPKHLHIRFKGQRNGYDVDYDTIMWAAFRQAAKARLKEQALQKTLRRVC